MLQYILETIAFQSAFLLLYDLFLKRETFFQWNRFYLMVTFLLSLALPWVTLEGLKTTITQESRVYPEFLWQLQSIVVTSDSQSKHAWDWPGDYTWILLMGSTVMTILFVIKLYHLLSLRKKGSVKYHRDFVKVLVPGSKLAFSFFGYVFIGDCVPKEKEPQIVEHELVHIRQWHSVDLILLEFMRIIFWFNPLLYVYHQRISEVHEFIADNEVSKFSRNEQYQLLLSEAFDTKNLSFINQFFQKSLIKKRIVMLSKEKSSSKNLSKYLTILPLVFLLICYTSCEFEKRQDSEASVTELVSTNAKISFAEIDETPIFPGCQNEEDTKTCFLEKIQEHVRKNFSYPRDAEEKGIQGRVSVMFVIDTNGEVVDVVTRGPDALLENEVMRIVNGLPKMEPGRHKGKPVNMPFSLPVVFKLE